MNLIVIYGSESSLLTPLYESENFFLRIYNNKTPEPKEHSADLHIGDIKNFCTLLKKIQKNINFNKVIFIGAAFQSDNLLLVNQSNKLIDASIEVNIKNYLIICRDLVKTIDLSKEKILIYLSSFRSSVPTSGATIYSSSKAFGEMLFKAMNEEYSRLNLRSSIIRMGYFDGRMMLHFDETAQSILRKKISLKRFGNSRELINCINFILDNPYTAGGIVDLNGGLLND